MRKKAFLLTAVLWTSLTAEGLKGQVPELQIAAIGDLPLASGAVLKNCRVGYRTFGRLNADRSNAVLFPTWFTGKSADLAGQIGPGRMVDSSRYFVIAVDALGNGVSSSPSNFGDAAAFPAIAIRDMVASQHRLLTAHLGIERLHAVVGISMGGMQTFEWMVAYPGFAAKAVPIIGSPKLTVSDLLLWDAQLSAIESAIRAGIDPRLVMPAVNAMHTFALHTPNYQAEQRAAADFAKLKANLEESARTGMDPRDRAVQLRAMMTQDVFRGGNAEAAGAKVRSRTLVVVAAQDQMVHPKPAIDFARLAGFQLLELSSNCGHMATSCESGLLAETVHAFLQSK